MSPINQNNTVVLLINAVFISWSDIRFPSTNFIDGFLFTQALDHVGQRTPDAVYKAFKFHQEKKQPVNLPSLLKNLEQRAKYAIDIMKNIGELLKQKILSYMKIRKFEDWFKKNLESLMAKVRDVVLELHMV